MADHLAHDHVGLTPARSATSGLALGSPERRAQRHSRRHKLRGSAASSLLSSTDDDALVQQALVWSNSEGRQWGTSNVDEIPAVQFGAGDEAGKTASTLPSIRPSRDTVYRVIITIGGTLARVCCVPVPVPVPVSVDLLLCRCRRRRLCVRVWLCPRCTHSRYLIFARHSHACGSAGCHHSSLQHHQQRRHARHPYQQRLREPPDRVWACR